MLNRGRVVLIVLILFLLTITSIHHYFTLYRETLSTYQSQVNRASQHLKLYLNGRIQALQILAAAKEMENLDQAEIRPELARVTKALGFVNMAVIAPNGRFIVAADSLSPEYASDLDSLRRALNGEPAVTDRIIYEGRETYFISIRIPIYGPQREIIAVLSAGIPPQELYRVINYESLPAEDELFLLDSAGQIIATESGEADHPLPAELYQKISADCSGYFAAKSAWTNSNMFYFYTSPARTPWRLVHGVPAEDVFYAFGKRLLGVIVIFCFLLVLMAFLYKDLNREARFRREIELQRFERMTAISQLAAAIAHEIRNPLTSIRGFVQLLKIRSGHLAPPGHLDIIIEEIDRVNQLIEGFRALNKPDERSIKEHIELADTVQDVVTLMEGQALVKRVRLNFITEKTGSVFGDANQLKQVWINLIRNALEATKPGDLIEVKVTSGDGRAVVSVADTGIGIPKEVITKLGKPFYTTKETGTGLGLSVCYNIIHSHGGKMDVESIPGEGTTFTVSLPLDEKN